MDPLDLILGGNPDPAAKAKALEFLMRQRQAGMINQFSGDKVLMPIGVRQFAGAEDRSAMMGRQDLARQADQAQAQRQAAKDAEDRRRWEAEMGLKRQALRLAKPDAAGGLKPQQFEQDVQKYGADMEEIAKSDPDIKVLQGFAAQADQPGFGPVEGRIPNMLTSDEGVAARQAAGRLMANYMKAMSGAVVNPEEVQRLLEARGIGRTATPQQFKQGVESFVRDYASLAQQRRAKYVPEVPQTYEARGGFKMGSGPNQAAVSAPGAASDMQRKTVNGKTYEKRADGWYEVL
jgi:hypothetical protein